MANRSPPIPLLIGSTTPSTALAAMAASIADPPRASVWLVATLPCREITMDRAWLRSINANLARSADRRRRRRGHAQRVPFRPRQQPELRSRHIALRRAL